MIFTITATQKICLSVKVFEPPGVRHQKRNAEPGYGFSDILIEPEDPDAGIVIEIKYASSIAGLDKACEEAMKQISSFGKERVVNGEIFES